MDYDANTRDHLKVRYQMDRGVQATGTDPINSVFNATSIQPEYNGQLTETHTFNSSTVNNLIISGAWYKALFGPSEFQRGGGDLPDHHDFRRHGFDVHPTGWNRQRLSARPHRDPVPTER